MIPWCVGVAVGAGLGNGLLGPRFGRPTLHGGLAVMIVGILTLIAAGSEGASAWVLATPELLAGIGMGAMLSPLFDFVLAGVADDEVGSASGVLNASQQLGGAIGIAVIGTIFFSVASASGLVGAFHETLWIEAGVLVVTAALVCLLPLRVREH
jgi:MFS family permease